MTVTNSRSAQVGETESFALDVTDWAEGESITSLSVTNSDSMLTIDAQSIDGYQLNFTATGLTAGFAVVKMEWETATRSRVECMRIRIESVCS